MNALWERAPEYAIQLNGGEAGQEAIPQADGKHIVGMFPGEGTDFLLLKDGRRN